jgi:succinate dehydrogenase/fumarate reductase flavoprotein subunit
LFRVSIFEIRIFSDFWEGRLELIDCDVLVIGSGGAGLRAAIEAKETFREGKVVLAAKGTLGKSGVTALACSDRMAFHATLPYTEPGTEDNWKYHAEDIYKIGGYVSDGDLAQVLARNSRQAFDYLDQLGVPFMKGQDGRADQFITDGSDYARACYTGPRTANHIEEALVRKISVTGVTVLDQCMVADLTQYRGRVIGAFGIDEKEEGIEERLKVFSFKTVVLATGGAGEAFSVHVFPPGMTGDGYAMAYRQGAELVNMEFIQIGLSSIKTRLACSGSMMRAIPRFLNEKGEEFLLKYFPRGTLSSEIYDLVFEKGASWPVSSEKRTCAIDVAVSKEMAGGHRIFLDYRENPQGFRLKDLQPKWQERYNAEIKRKRGDQARQGSPLRRLEEINPDSIAWLKEHGIDLHAGERIEIAPAVQHFQGGIRIRDRANTSLKGLYAAGECAGGQHGANRPGGNALLDGQVFGKIAGREAALEAKSSGKAQRIGSLRIKKFLTKLRNMDKGKKSQEVRREIQEITSGCAGVVRTEEGLRKGLKCLEKLKKEGISVDGKGLIFALETENLLDVAEMILRSALYRKESRGPHLFFSRFEDRDPLPPRDPVWRKYIVIRREMERMVLETRTPLVLKI